MKCHCGKIIEDSPVYDKSLCLECRPVANLIDICEDFKAGGLSQDVISDYWEKELPDNWPQERIDALIRWLKSVEMK